MTMQTSFALLPTIHIPEFTPIPSAYVADRPKVCSASPKTLDKTKEYTFGYGHIVTVVSDALRYPALSTATQNSYPVQPTAYDIDRWIPRNQL